MLRVVSALLPLLLVGCSETTGSSGEDVPYDVQLAGICTATREDLDALPRPPEEIALADFASEVAGVVGAEADAARTLDPPAELDEDHRAFVANTDEQAAAWERIAATASTDPEVIGEERNLIAQLTLGRDDLAVEMGIDECRRGE